MPKKIEKKWTWRSISLALCGAGIGLALLFYISWIFLFGHVALWGLQKQIDEQLRLIMRFEAWEGGPSQLRVQQASLENPSDGTKFFEVKDCRVRSQLSLLDRQLSFQILLDEPQIPFSALDLLNHWETRPSTYWSELLEADVALEVRDGRILLGKEGDDREIFFSMREEGGWHHVEASFEEQVPKPQLQATVGKRDGMWVAEVQLHELPCESLSHLARLPGLSAIGDWHLTEGMLSGKVNCSWQDETPQLRGQLCLEDSSFENLLLNSKIAAKKVHLELEPSSKRLENSLFSLWSRLLLSTQITLEADEGEAYAHIVPGDHPWKLDRLKGRMNLNPSGRSLVTLNGEMTQASGTSTVEIEGAAEGLLSQTSFFDMRTYVLGPKGELSTLLMNVQDDGKRQALQSTLLNLGPEEWTVLREIFAFWYPEVHDFDVEELKADATLELELSNYSLEKIRIDDLLFREVKLQVLSLNLPISFRELGADLELTFDPQKTWLECIPDVSADVNFSGLAVDLKGPSQGMHHFEDLTGACLVEAGEVKRGYLQGEFSGLQAAVTWDRFSREHLIEVHALGKGREIALPLSPELRQLFSDTLAERTVKVHLGINGQGEAFFVDGRADVEEVNEGGQSLRFGFEITKPDHVSWLETLFKDRLFLETQTSPWDPSRECFAKMERPSQAILEEWDRLTMANDGLAIRKGWLSAADVPLDIFFSPLLFTEESETTLHGTADVEGAFNHQFCVLEYLPKKLQIDCPYYSLSFGDAPIHTPMEGDSPFNAFHFFDLSGSGHFGALPLSFGEMTIESNGLQFSDLHGTIRIAGGLLSSDALNGSCEGLEILTNFSLDLRDPDCFILDLQSKEVFGGLPSFFQVLQKLSPSSIWDWPMEGELSSGPKEFHVKGSFYEDRTDWETEVAGRIESVAYQTSTDLLSLQDWQADFHYSLGNSSLSFSNLKGGVKLGNASKEAGSPIYSHWTCPRLDIEDLSDINLNFKFNGILPEGTELSLEGKGHWLGGEDGESFLVFLNGADNFWGNLSLFDWEIDIANGEFSKTSFSGSLEGPLEDFDELLQAASNANLSSRVPEGLLGEGYLDREEFFQLDLAYCWKDAVGQLHFVQDSSSLNLEHDGKSWALDATWDAWKANASFTWTEGALDFDKLTLKHPSIASLNLRGQLDLGTRSFQGWLFDGSLDANELCKIFTDMDLNLHGKLQGSGGLKASFASSDPYYGLDGDFRFFLAEGQLSHFPFQLQRPFRVRVKPQGNIEVHDLVGDLPGLGLKASLDDLCFSPKTWELKKSNWELNPEKMEDLESFVVESLGIDVPQGTVEWTQRLRMEPWAFSLKGQIGEDSYGDLKIADGDFRILGMSKTFQNIALHLSQDGYFARFETQLGPIPTAGSLKAHWEGLWRGDLFLRDLREEDSICAVSWVLGEDGFPEVHKARGRFGEAEISLEGREEGDQWIIGGSFDLEGAGLWALFGENFAEGLNWLGVGRGLKLSGDFKCPRAEPEKYEINGFLKGKNFSILGYELEKLSALFSLESQSFHLKDLQVEDPAFRGRMEVFHVHQEDEISPWTLWVPEVRMENFRPHLLRSLTGPPGEPSRLVIERMSMKEIRGYLADSSTLTGRGSLNFVNGEGRNFRNLLAIPFDILSRIGLDAQLLTPMSGSISYEMGGGKVFFTDFKDVFSEGRRSRFFLAENYPSNIDFQGNLDILIRVKQQVLLKYAELHPISITGTIGSPVYGFRKPDRDIVRRRVGKNRIR